MKASLRTLAHDVSPEVDPLQILRGDGHGETVIVDLQILVVTLHHGLPADPSVGRGGVPGLGKVCPEADHGLSLAGVLSVESQVLEPVRRPEQVQLVCVGHSVVLGVEAEGIKKTIFP